MYAIAASGWPGPSSCGIGTISDHAGDSEYLGIMEAGKEYDTRKTGGVSG